MSKPIALLAYQDADLEKQQLEADLRATENRVRLNKLAKFIKQQQANLTKLNEEIETFSASMSKLNTQYTALLDRLDLETSEFETLKGDEECTSEEMTAEFQKTRQQGAKAKKEYDQLKVVCQKEKDDAAIDLLAADRKMEELEKKVSPTLMNRYKRVRQHHNMPVVEVRDGKCSGCNMSLPSLAIRRLIGEDMILECENCGRLLYADNE